ncbi:hypothetical protein [Actinocatenispora comari]|uniref:Uncharacterized protein n=1 Tax=Actinocatenispora comari TaxID=2807577 RepID=A0A8J4AJJ6_9ACTN|nr:hypothetical protein [Actinocatenispora comari]GIL29928.1 hypothetical protein NUM_51820 [Actinocatenispora comari]
MPQTRNRRTGDDSGTAVNNMVGETAVSVPRFPVAYASAWAPSARRTRWVVVTRCPFCGAGHVSYAHEIERAGGLRRPGCRPGARYWVAVARTYTGEVAE